MNKFINITQLSKLLKLTNSRNNKPQNYVLRYWEKEFKQIKPKLINKRRYYSSDQVNLIKFINYLIKEKGMTLSGVKKLLNSDINKLDDYNSYSLKASYYKNILKTKSVKILKKVNNLKKYGKKNSPKS